MSKSRKSETVNDLKKFCEETSEHYCLKQKDTEKLKFFTADLRSASSNAILQKSIFNTDIIPEKKEIQTSSTSAYFVKGKVTYKEAKSIELVRNNNSLSRRRSTTVSMPPMAVYLQSQLEKVNKNRKPPSPVKHFPWSGCGPTKRRPL